jgi:hypothetical protein
LRADERCPTPACELQALPGADGDESLGCATAVNRKIWLTTTDGRDLLKQTARMATVLMSSTTEKTWPTGGTGETATPGILVERGQQ